MSNRLKPLNDVVFKKIFGENHDKELLIGLLNAILNSNIIDVQILEEKLTIEKVSDKQGYLDIKAECANGDKINIEVQLRDQKNMIPRTLFYWSRLYSENFAKKAQYSSLRKTIVINILGFNLVQNVPYHSCYHIYEDGTRVKLTELMEIHFIEFPKFKELKKDMNNPLHRWLLFLQGDIIPKKVLKEVIRMDQLVQRADEKLTFLSADDEIRRLAELREKGIADQIAREELAEEKGRTHGRHEGMKEGKIETAKNMLQMGLPLDVISKATGIPIDEIKKL